MKDHQKKPEEKKQDQKKGAFNPAGLLMGLGVGLCFGAAMNNIAVGLALGVCFGTSFSTILGRRKDK